MATRKYKNKKNKKNVKKRTLMSKKNSGKYGGSTKSSTRKKSPSYKHQDEVIRDIKNTLTNEINNMKITNKSSQTELEHAENALRYLKDVKNLEEINDFLEKSRNRSGGKRVRKTRKCKR